MKKRFLYIIASFLFVVVTGFMMLKAKKTKSDHEKLFSNLIPRTTASQQATEWKLVQARADALAKKIDENPSDIKSLLALTALYVNEGRVTGNLTYYNEAALKTAEAVLKQDAGHFEALIFRSMILLSQHRFEEGLVVARQVQQKYPYNAFVYGLMVDANVELGNYPAALEAADKMISIRPDLRSYSRIAYLREIHGDIPGATDAMKMAVDAGAPGDESTEWCRIQMAKLYEQLGKIKEAAMQYTIAVENRPGYAYAVAGLARIAVAKKEYEKALALYQQAAALLPDHTFKEGMAEVYTLAGQPAKAAAIAKEILQQMKKLSGNRNKGQNEDHEMAHAWMGVNDYAKALEYALAEYKRRPANIEVNETVAIVYYRQQNYAKALPYIDSALKTNCKNPQLLCHAGLIYAKAGNKTKAKALLQEALKNKPMLSPSLQSEAEEMAGTLQ